MIIVKIWGGIGNQLFQYVFGQYLHYRYQQEVRYDDNAFVSVDKLRKRELDALSADIEYDNRCIFSRFRGIKNRLLRYGFQLNPKHHFVQEGKSLPMTFNEKHIYFFQGYWQDVKYYNWLKENVPDFELRSKLFPKELESLRNQIDSSNNSASLHVRRGDYFAPHFIKTFGVCDSLYFEKSISILLQQKHQAQLFVFSDDLDWVKNNIKLPVSAVLIPNYNISQFAYIELMSFCKHHIISNSSFSWWGAVMNALDDAIVICPSKWLLTSNKTIAKSDWTKIDITNKN